MMTSGVLLALKNGELGLAKMVPFNSRDIRVIQADNPFGAVVTYVFGTFWRPICPS